MIEKLKKHIASEFPFLSGKRLLLAVSGGLDSLVMADLFRSIGFETGIAHVNFSLRGQESDADQDFVRSWSEKNNLPFFTQTFDTDAFAADHKLSIQQAARELRYRWFEEIRQSENFDFILTAHHADDDLETFLINFSRGTGIEGLTGIPRQNGFVIRPMLVFSREEIAEYAASENIGWREDSSNASEKYLRNKIRHAIVPHLKESNPNLIDRFSATRNYLAQTQKMAEDAAILVFQKVASVNQSEIAFDLSELKKLPNFKSYLYFWLRDYRFPVWENVYDLADAETGKQVHSETHTLLRDRNRLVLFPIRKSSNETRWIQEGETSVNFPVKLRLEKADALSQTSNSVIFVDARLLEFPLEVRHWRQGDTFCPIGMDGKSKKLSKFFKDEKVPLHEKSEVWLLLSNGKIVWVISMRADERFKIQPTTTNILRISHE